MSQKKIASNVKSMFWGQNMPKCYFGPFDRNSVGDHRILFKFDDPSPKIDQNRLKYPKIAFWPTGSLGSLKSTMCPQRVNLCQAQRRVKKGDTKVGVRK